MDPILGIKDVRTDKRIDFVGICRGTKELERLVNEGRAAVAFSLHATTVDDPLRVSDAGKDHAAKVDLVRTKTAGWIVDT